MKKDFEIKNQTITLTKTKIATKEVPFFYRSLLEITKKNEIQKLDLSKVARADSAFFTIINRFSLLYPNIEIVLNSTIKERYKVYQANIDYQIQESKKVSMLEKLVLKNINFENHIKKFIILAADSFYYSFKAIFNKKGRRAGSIYEQIELIGYNALPIVGLLSFLIGLILSLQSAQQLKQFGANIFLVDLVVIAMISEMGPMMTAVIVAGRSGSSVAAEIATMKITEEIDALKVMALHPLKYILAPKVIAISISLPLLTIAANIIGIIGGFLIAVLYLDLTPEIFISRAFAQMSLYIWNQSILKSLLFSWIIVLIGAYFGFNVKGGAEGVGKATTAAVVASIFSVIMTDAVLSLVFYFNF